MTELSEWFPVFNALFFTPMYLILNNIRKDLASIRENTYDHESRLSKIEGKLLITT